MSTVAAELPVSSEVREALEGRSNHLSPCLDCVTAYEQGRWSEAHAAAAAFGIDDGVIPDLYLQTVEWTNAVFKDA
jgi:EAL and modified HD-GYP domain-containing signal transduction protein